MAEGDRPPEVVQGNDNSQQGSPFGYYPAGPGSPGGGALAGGPIAHENYTSGSIPKAMDPWVSPAKGGIAGGPTINQDIHGGSGGGGGGATANGTGQFNGFDIGGLMLSADGQVYGQRRVLSGDPKNPGSSTYGYETVPLGNISDLNAISAASSIPVPALTQRVAELKVQNAQTARGGLGKIIGQNPDGSYSFFDPAGTIQKTTDESALAGAGIQPSEIQQAKNDRAAGIRAAAQQGEYTVVGQNADGTVSVRDYNGQITNVPAQQASILPGVAAADLQRAQTDYLQGSRTQHQAGQYSVTGMNADGTVSVRNFNGEITNVSPQQAAQLPGVSASDLQRAQSENLQSQRTINEAGTWTPQAINPDGSVQIRNGAGTIYTVTADHALDGTFPGISRGQIAYMQTQASDTNFALSQVPNYGAQQAAYSNGRPGIAVLPTGAPAIQSGADTRYQAQPAGGPVGSTPPTAAQQAAYSTYSGGSGSPLGSTPPRSTGYASTAVQPQSASTATYGTAAQSAGGPSGSTPSGYSAAGFSGSQQDLTHANQGMQNYYQYGKNEFDIAHQGQEQANTAYRYNQQTTEGQNAGQSRNLSGLGWSGITRPTIAGTS